MGKIMVYQKPTCTTCRQTVQILKDEQADYTTINYYDQPFTKARLKDLLKKAGLKPRDVLRTKEDIYKTLKLRETAVGDDELLDLMVKHPDLIQRPIVQQGETVILARPAETVRDLLT